MINLIRPFRTTVANTLTEIEKIPVQEFGILTFGWLTLLTVLFVSLASFCYFVSTIEAPPKAVAVAIKAAEVVPPLHSPETPSAPKWVPLSSADE